jgi:phytoene dehydrogenase-like protein
MSTSPRIDLLGLAELDSRLAQDSVFPEVLEALDEPATRSARIESRRAFVEMKQLFLRAVENLEHRKAAWLRAQVRGAEDPIDLWLLRGPLLATLREDDRATRTMRAALYRSLDRTFPEAFGSAEISALLSQRP